MNTSALKKTLRQRFEVDGGPHNTGKKLGVSAFALVMLAHGYSRPHAATVEKLEKKLSGRKVVRQAAKRA